MYEVVVMVQQQSVHDNKEAICTLYTTAVGLHTWLHLIWVTVSRKCFITAAQ